MNKDVEKIRAEIEKLRQKVINGATSGQYSSETIREKNQLLVSLISFIDSMQEEPVYTDFTKALAECIHQAQGSVFDPMVHAELWENELVKLAKSKEPVSEDLEEAAVEAFKQIVDSDKNNFLEIFKAGAKWRKAKDESTTEDLGEYINELSKQFPEVSFAKLSRIAIRVAKWQKNHLWKPADGNDLPIIDREVIALLDNGKVVFAHRPYKGKYIGKNLTTGNIETFENETYDKGGWNIPNVKWWLDCLMPKEIEL